MNKTITVLIADDTDVGIFGLRSIFDTTNEISVIGATQSVYEIPRMIGELSPDVLIMDLKWYQDNVAGWMTIKEIREADTPVKIIALTAYENLMQDAWRQGADAVIAKTYTRDQLIALVKSVYNEEYNARQKRMYGSPTHQETLTQREMDVLLLLQQGMSNQEIGETLNVSIHTAKNHVKSIREKLDAENRHKAVAKAKEMGILS